MSAIHFACRCSRSLAVAMLLIAASCADAWAEGGAGSGDDWPSSIAIGTASQGGTYLIYGAGLVKLMQEELGIAAAAEVTGGPVQNLALIETGQLALGMTTMGPAHEAWIGENQVAPGMDMRSIRALFPMYESPFHMIALEGSGIGSAADLEGKRVGVGPRGGTSAAYFPRYFEQLGITAEPRYGGASDLAAQLQDGLIDAFALAIGAPIAAFTQIETQQPAVVFTFGEEENEQLLEDNPALTSSLLPSSTYRSQKEEQSTISMWSFVVGHKDLPESLVYEIMRTVFEDEERMKTVHASASQTLLDNWKHNSVLPFHAGAVRYLQDQGIEVPPERIPEEFD